MKKGWDQVAGGQLKTSGEQRGQHNLVAIVLLFGMVFAGATIVFLSAGVLVDGLESEAGTEQIRSTMGSIDHDMWTASSGGGSYELPQEGYDRATTTDNGTIAVSWYDEGENPDFTDENSSSLGELQLDSDETTTKIVHQGGGIWEVSDSEVSLRSTPDIGFNGDSLRVSVMQIQSDGGTPSRIEGNQTAAATEMERLSQIAQNPDGDNFAIKIESEYADGWKRHFENEKQGVTQWGDITVDKDGDNVTLEIKDIGDTAEPDHVIVEEDRGLTEAPSSGNDIEGNTIKPGDMFKIDGVVRNTGAETDIDVTLSIYEESDLIEERTISQTAVDEGGSLATAEPSDWQAGVGNALRFDPDDIGLSPGNIYQYDITTSPGGDSLDQKGTFYYMESGNHYTVTDTEDTVTNETVTLSGTIQNRGDESGTEDVTLEVWSADEQELTETSKPVSLNSSEEATVEWSINKTSFANGEYDYRIGTATDDAFGTFEVSDRDTQVVEIDPTLMVDDIEVADPVEPGETVTVEAEIENLRGTGEQAVRLDGFDGTEVGSQNVTLSSGETETVSFEYETDSNAITDRITVRTEDNEMEAIVAIERDGPQCHAVEYDGSGTSDDPYQISTVDELQCINEQGLEDHYELTNDIDAHGTEYWNDGSGFEPIGPTGNRYTTEAASDDADEWETFGGEFDGNGYVIEGLYIERPDEEFVGLFGATNYPRGYDGFAPGEGSLIENVRLDDVYVHGERHVGGLAGQAGGTIKDSRSNGTVKAEYQLVGGLIGDGAHADLDNRLVAEGTVIGGDFRTPTAEEVDDWWEAEYYWNRGIGGLLGRSTWQTDVSTGYTETKVKGPSMIGGIVGSSSQIESNFTQMYSVPELEIQSSGTATERPEYQGAIAGTIENDDDRFTESVYHDQSPPYASQTYGEEYYTDSGWTANAIARETAEMQGLGVTESGRMDALDYEADGGPWVAVPGDYPRFVWELEAEAAFEVTIDDVEDVTAGESAAVEVTVTNHGEDSNEANVTQTIVLTDPDGEVVDAKSVTLPSTPGTHEEKQITLSWQTDLGDVGTNEIGASSEDMATTAQTEVTPPTIDFSDRVTASEIDVGPGQSDTAIPESRVDIDVNVDVVRAT